MGHVANCLTTVYEGEDYGLGSCKLILDNGPFEVDFVRMGNGSNRPIELCVNRVIEHMEAPLFDPHGNKDIGGCLK